MNFNDLWVGDEVFVRSKGVNGRWEGLVSKDKARVRISEKIFLLPLSDLGEAVLEKNVPPPEKIISESDASFRPDSKHAEIDLHIEKLNPERANDLPEMIRDYQIRKCREFILECIRNKRPTALVIHGKGKGVLKAEVLHYLKGVPEVKFLFEKKDGGATEIWFSSPY